MRTLLAVMLLAATAEAAPTTSHRIMPVPAPVDLATVPRICTPLAREANVPRIRVALSARISLAQCLAGQQIAAQTDLIDAQDSIAQLEASIAPSFALLDAAIASDDPALVVEAQHARGTLYLAMTTRMTATLPHLPANPSDETMELRDQRAAVLATWLQPWRDQAHDAFTAAVATGRKYQGPIAQDPTAAAALADSQRQLRGATTVPNS
jgi:hypothetical protein